MKIILTDHAKKRMNEREISIREINETIEFPDYSVSKGMKIESHKNINNKNIKIIYLKTTKFIKIITVILK